MQKLNEYFFNYLDNVTNLVHIKVPETEQVQAIGRAANYALIALNSGSNALPALKTLNLQNIIVCNV